MKRLRKFLALNPSERRMFVASSVLLLAVSQVLRWRGFAAARGFVSALPAGAGRRTSAEVARMVSAASSLTGVSCLPRSLVLWRLLRERGAAIRFGVDCSRSNDFAAHAWVELDGVPLIDEADVGGRFAVLEPAVQRLGA